MSLSRTRRRELQQLRSQAESLLEQQREVLGRAGKVAGEATRQAKYLGSETLLPKINEAATAATPYLERGANAVRRTRILARLLTAPILAGALNSTVRGLERLENQQAAQHVQQFGVARGLIKAPKKRSGVARLFLIGAAVAAASAVGYALWQAVRDDDELWVTADTSTEE